MLAIRHARNSTGRHLPGRKWGLIAVLIASVAMTYYWQRVHRPHQLLAQAKALAAKRPFDAEKLAAAAIEQSGGTFPDAQLLSAILLTKLGRSTEALGQFSLIEKPEQLLPEQLAELGRTAIARGDKLLAERAFQVVHKDSAVYLPSLRSLIQLHLEMGREEVSESECRTLLELLPTDSTAWQIIGTIAMNRKQLDVAKEAFRQCLKYSQDAEQIRGVREDLIQVSIDSGDVANARLQLSILSADSATPSPRAVIEEAYVLRMEGEADRAIALINPLVSQDMKFNARVLLLRGLLLFDVGEDGAAISDFEKVVAEQPWNKEAHHKLSIAYGRIGKSDAAAEHRKIAEELTSSSLDLLNLTNELLDDPSNESLRRRIAELYRKLGRADEADRLQRF